MELQQLGLAALRLPGSLEELGASPLFAAAANDLPDAAELAALLQKARQESATALDWGQVLQTLRGGQLQASQASQLVGVLARAADSARQQLEAVTASSGRPSGGSAAPAAVGAGGDPRLATALRNSLKLSLFFLCCLARGEGSAAGPQAAQAAGGGGGQRRGAAKKAKAGGGVDTASAATAALAQLRARRDALLAINAIEEAVHACRALLPAVPDLRAAAQAARRAALHCLVHPSPVVVADRGAKDLAVACSQAATDILARPLVMADELQAHAAAAQTLQDLLGVVAEPKQPAQVLAAAARLVANVMQQSSRAGFSVISRLADRIQQLAAAASSGGGHGSRDAAAAAAAAAAEQQLNACLHFAALLAATGGAPQLQPALLLCLPPLLPLARHGSSSTRRLMLDLCRALLPAAERLPRPSTRAHASGAKDAAVLPAAAAATSPAQAISSALLAAVVSRLGDRDATLRAKALACLEKHAPLAAAHLSSAGGSSDLVQALCSRLCDKSPSVRKRAVSLLAALLAPAAGLAPAAAAALADAALPVASRLLGVRPDSALRPGEEALQALSQAVLSMAASSISAAGVPHLLRLAGGASEAATQKQLQAAVLDLLLPPAAVPAPHAAAGEALLRNLGEALRQCSRQQSEQLRDAVQGWAGLRQGGRAPAAVVEAVRLCYQRLHSLACTANQQAAEEDPAATAAAAAAAAEGAAVYSAEVQHLVAALFVLGPLSGPADAAIGLPEVGLLLSSLQRTAAATDALSSGGDAPAAVWLLRCLALAWQQLGPACFPSDGPSGSNPSSQALHTAAAAGSAQATLLALQSALLDPSCSSAVRQGALEVAFALPPAAQGPLRLLRSLTAAATSGKLAAAGAVLAPAVPAHLQLDEEQGVLCLVAAGVRGGALAPTAAAEDEEGGEAVGATVAAAAAAAGTARKQQVQSSALVALLDLLGGLAATYKAQGAEFLQRLQAGASAGQQQQPPQQHQTSKAGRPLRPAAEWWVGAGQTSEGGAAPGSPGGEAAASAGATAGAGDYMQAEAEASKQAEAAQRFLESLVEAGVTPPACYLPLLELLAAGGGEEGVDGAAPMPPVVQAAALRALGCLALLSEPLSRLAVQAAEAGLHGGRSEVRQAAVAVLADSISAFPNAYSDRLLLIGRLIVPPMPEEAVAAEDASEAPGAQEAPSTDLDLSAAQPLQQLQQGSDAHLARTAAAAYCRLLLHNRLKLQGQLGPVGAALVHGFPHVAAVVRHALRQLLAAQQGPKERARLCMSLFHQTPLGCRAQLAQALVDPSAGLLSEADLRGDVLVGQGLQALLAAAGTAPGGGASTEVAGGGGGIAAAAALLRAMQPSAKVLAALATQLQAGGGGGALLGRLPPTARQALCVLVSNHHAAAAGQADDGEPAAAGAGSAGAGGGSKRKRGAGGGKGGSADLQQQLLGMLSSGSRGGSRHGAAGRPPRPAAAATAGAGSAAATPTASGWTSSRPASTTRGGSAAATAMPGRTPRGGAASRQTSAASLGGGSRRYINEEDSDVCS